MNKGKASQQVNRTAQEPSEIWRRKPEPITKLEGAQEYRDAVVNTFRESDQEFALELAEKIPQGYKVVEIGSGPGFQSIFLAHRRPDLTILCLDYNPEMNTIASQEAEKAGVVGYMEFQQADMTQLPLPSAEEREANGDTQGIFFFANTAHHEVRNRKQFEQAIAEMARVMGEKDGCYIRDLALPKDEVQAAAWRREVVDDTKLPKREFELFYNSQRAGFRLDIVQKAVEKTSLKNRAVVTKLEAPKSRYWALEVSPS